MFSKLVFLAALAFASAQTPFPFDDVLSAVIDVDPDTGDVQIELTGFTGGWVGVGANLGDCETLNGTSMIGADLIIGWVNAEGEGVALDMHGKADANGLPIVDDVNDVELLEAEGDDAFTRIVVRKAANPEDSGDLLVGPGDIVSLIWAWGETDPVGDVPAPEDYHSGNRGCVDSVVPTFWN